MPTLLTTTSVDSGDVSLFVRQFGLRTARTPLLILHGANYYDSADWIDVGCQLGRDREVMAFDARGFGNSTWSPSKDYGLATVLDDVRAVIDHAGWQRGVILGHSRGGSQALLAAARMPEIIAGLVLVDYNPGRGFIPPSGAALPAAMPMVVFPTIEAALESTTRYKTDPLTPDMRARALEFLQPVDGGFQLAKRDPSFLTQAAGRGVLGLRSGYEELEEVQCPVLVVRAKRSSTLTQEDWIRLRSIGHVQLRDLDSGHDVAGEASSELIREVSEWVQRVC